MQAQKICPNCGAVGELQKWGKTLQRRTRYRCTICHKTCTARTGTIRSRSRLSDREWSTLARLTSLRTCPSGADLGRLFQRSAKTGQRYRKTIRQLLPGSTAGPPLGTSELDETTFRGQWIGGAKCRATRQIKLMPLTSRNEFACRRFVDSLLAPNATAFTDEWGGYRNLNRRHFTVCHAREFVHPECSLIHTNGIEGVWGHAKPLARHTYRGYPNLQDFLREICFLFNFSYAERCSYLTARFFRPTRSKTNT